MKLQIAYKEGKSWFHYLDPITKMTWALILALWLFCLRDWSSVLAVSCFAMIIAFVGARINLVKYIRFVIPMLLMGISLIVYQGIFRPGPGINIGPLRLSYEGIQIGIAIVSRTFGLVASALAFSVTTSPKHIMLAMIRLGFSYRFAYIIYLALRFIPVCATDFESIEDAQTLRGVKKGVKRYVRSTVSILITELRHSDDTAAALETRAFGLHETRTSLEKITITPQGVFLASITAILMILHITWLGLLR